MGVFNKAVVTAKGQALLAKSVAGICTLQFTQIALSDTVLEGDLSTITDIGDIKQASPIANKEMKDSGTVAFEATFVNTELTEGYRIRNIGLYARDPDEGEILYSVSVADESEVIAGWMPSYDGMFVKSLLIELVTSVSNAQSVSVEVDPTVFATVNQVTKMLNDARASGAFDGKDGVDGKDGADGVSPTITVTPITNGKRVFITDKVGTRYVDLTNGNDGYTPQKGVDYFDGNDGTDGKDGVSPTITTSKSGKVTTVTITDKAGTKTFTVSDGNDGASGEDGTNGEDGKDGTSVTVSNVTESSVSGGNNTVTFSDGKTLTIKNGKDGINGTNGKTPVKGTDYFTQTDIDEIVERVIEYFGGMPIVGMVDENNNIIITSDLADGTYVFKYELTDGTCIDIGSLVVSGLVQYSITANLTECTADSGNATVINSNGTVTLRYVAKDGFTLDNTITVSGASYNWDSTTGTLVLSNPTSNVSIAITATKSGVNNLADPTADGWVNNSRIGSNGQAKAEGQCTGAVVTNFIPVGDRSKSIYIKGLDIVNKLPDNNTGAHSRYSAMDVGTYIGHFYANNISSYCIVNGDVTEFTLGTLVLANEYIRFTGTLLSGYTANDVIITLGEPIE